MRTELDDAGVEAASLLGSGTSYPSQCRFDLLHRWQIGRPSSHLMRLVLGKDNMAYVNGPNSVTC